MRKNNAVWLLMLFFIQGTLVVNAQVDAKADKLIKSAKKKLNSFQDLSAEFIWTMENKASGDKPSVKKGKIQLKNEKYKITFADREMFCDGKTVWDYLKKENEVNVSKYNPKEGMSFQKIFRLYDEGMKSRLEQPEKIGNVVVDKISLFPLLDKEFFKVELWIEKNSEYIRKMKIHNKNGTNHIFEMNSITTNNGLPENHFRFDQTKYPKVEVIDLQDE